MSEEEIRKKVEKRDGRVNSISYQITGLNTWQRIGRNFGADLLMGIMINLVYFGMAEYGVDSRMLFSNYRYIGGDSLKLSEIAYHVGLAGGEVDFLTIPIKTPLLFIWLPIGIFFLLQILGALIAMPAQNRRIRKLLSPINEAALKADQLSRMSFSEDKYQEIEDAIDRLQLDAEKPLDLGDQDLSGIEAALNNMLIRMKESYDQQARFVNDASHELRTPIAVIQGYANMLSRWGKEDQKVLDESITAIQHESDHMKYLVEQLLFLARGDSGRTRLELEETDLNALMQEIYEESLMIDEKHPYRLQLSDRKIMLSADQGLLKQAVRILIDNAAKYTKDHEEIILSVGLNEKDRPYLQVQDTGIGMAEADVAHMFERFYRADDARTYDGTGLGLSIAKWIVDKHKGHFEIISRTELGTRIRIVL